MKVIEYSVVRGNTITDVVRNMRLAIDDGFQPIGGIAVGEMNFYQAVVKYEDAPAPAKMVTVAPNNYSDHPCN